jgi:superfamily I DNA/RNA helicase
MDVTRRTWLIGSSNLTPDQKKVAHAPLTENQLVTGPAGSGKTLLLLHRAAHIIKEYKVQPPRIGVMVYTNVLKRYIRSGIQELDLSENMVQLFYDWVEEYYKGNVRDRLPWNRERKGTDYVRAVNQVCDHHETSQRKPCFDVLLVDEGQDLPPDAFRLLKRMAHHVTVFADPTQRLYTDGATMGDAIKGLGLRRESQVLLQNFRNAPAVAQVASRFLTEDEAVVYLRTRAAPNSSAYRIPLLYVADNGRQELERLAELIAGEVAQGKRVGIMLPTNSMVKGIATGMKDRGVDVETVLARGYVAEDFNALTPKVLTVHSAKGLTFDTVFIPRIVDSKYSWARNVDKMLFVASTRALEWVYYGTVDGEMCEELKWLLPLEEKGQLVIQTPQTITEPKTVGDMDGDDDGFDLPI